jgi:ubiquinone/menaquinone biosynthesis C-methylase UbiE
VIGSVLRRRRKHRDELAYWSARAGEEGRLSGGHYEHFFTTHFGLDRGFYAGKRLLDVGCGPRGSLEWASEAAERVGLDPLAGDYARFRDGTETMRYVAAGAERMPFADASFDVVSSLNSLDHVDDLDAAIAEIARVAAPGASLLLIVDVEHEPTTTEPQWLGWEILERFAPAWVQADVRRLARPDDTTLGSVLAGRPYGGSGPGVLSARLERRG